MKYFKKLIGTKIYLSPRIVEDTELYTTWMNDPAITDYIGRSHSIVTLEGEKEYLESSSKKSDSMVFAIVDLETNELIGDISLNKIDHIRRTATLGIFVAVNRSQGIGTEAIKLILDYGFNYLNLNNIDLQVLDVNARAIRCYEKAGFKKYGTRRKAVFLNGKYHDMVFMDILAEEFTEESIQNKEVK